jgi:tetratricopeptide (TPR) repeat protein
MADVEKAIALKPGDPDALDTRGHILLALGQTARALEDFNAALQKRPDAISSQWGRGLVYEGQGLAVLAVIDFKRAIELKATGADELEAQEKVRARLVALSNALPSSGSSGNTSSPK